MNINAITSQPSFKAVYISEKYMNSDEKKAAYIAAGAVSSSSSYKRLSLMNDADVLLFKTSKDSELTSAVGKKIKKGYKIYKAAGEDTFTINSTITSATHNPMVNSLQSVDYSKLISAIQILSAAQIDLDKNPDFESSKNEIARRFYDLEFRKIDTIG